jgi:hypothetical protein
MADDLDLVSPATPRIPGRPLRASLQLSSRGLNAQSQFHYYSYPTLRGFLHRLGIPPQRGRTSAIRQLVLQIPAPVLAQALGYHHTSTTRIAAEAGSPLGWLRVRDPRPTSHSRDTA